MYTAHQRWNSVKDLVSRGILVVAYERLSSCSENGLGGCCVGTDLECVGGGGRGNQNLFSLSVLFHNLCNSVARDEQATSETHTFPREGPNSVEILGRKD